MLDSPPLPSKCDLCDIRTGSAFQDTVAECDICRREVLYVDLQSNCLSRCEIIKQYFTPSGMLNILNLLNLSLSGREEIFTC